MLPLISCWVGASIRRKRGCTLCLDRLPQYLVTAGVFL